MDGYRQMTFDGQVTFTATITQVYPTPTTLDPFEDEADAFDFFRPEFEHAMSVIKKFCELHDMDFEIDEVTECQ